MTYRPTDEAFPFSLKEYPSSLVYLPPYPPRGYAFASQYENWNEEWGFLFAEEKRVEFEQEQAMGKAQFGGTEAKSAGVEMAYSRQRFEEPPRAVCILNRLSWEVLAEIFRMHIEDHHTGLRPTREDFSEETFFDPIHDPHNAVLVLASVSRLWRNVTINTSRFWTYIHIDGTHLPELKTPERISSYGRWLASTIRLWVERAGTRQLHIGIDEADMPLGIRRAIDPVLLPQMERCYRFGHYNSTGPTIYTAIATPVLREAFLSTANDAPIGSIFPKAPQLQYLTASTDCDMFRLPPLRFPRLTYLNLYGKYDLQLEDLLSKLGACSNTLQRLRLNFVDLGGVSLASVALPRLHTLQIREPLLLQHFTQLDLLKTLFWEYDEWEEVDMRIIHQAIPALENLHVFPLNPSQRVYVDESEFVSVLDELKELRTLFLNGLSIGSTTLDALANREPPICPKLTDLSILRSRSVEMIDFVAMVHERRCRNVINGTPALLQEVELEPDATPSSRHWEVGQLAMDYAPIAA